MNIVIVLLTGMGGDGNGTHVCIALIALLIVREVSIACQNFTSVVNKSTVYM